MLTVMRFEAGASCLTVEPSPTVPDRHDHEVTGWQAPGHRRGVVCDLAEDEGNVTGPSRSPFGSEPWCLRLTIGSRIHNGDTAPAASKRLADMLDAVQHPASRSPWSADAARSPW